MSGRRRPSESGLVIQLYSELENSRIVSVGDRAKVAGSQRGADAAVLDVTFKLSVIPGVEALGAQLKPGAAILAEDEALEQGQVPVVTARTRNAS